MNKNGFLFLAVFFVSSISFAGEKTPINPGQAKQFMESQGVSFLENKGQMVDMDKKPVPFVLFKAEAPSLDLYVTEKGLTYLFKSQQNEETNFEPENHGLEEGLDHEPKHQSYSWERVDLTLKNASIKKENIIKEGMQQGFEQYFFPHCPDGISDVRSYTKITVKDVYPGIDWVLYNPGNKGFKYDFIVHPGADPAQIILVYASLNPLKLNKNGGIEIKTEHGVLQEEAPYSYISENGEEVKSKFKVRKVDDYNTEVTFGFQEFRVSKSTTLVIDPQLVWYTFYGGGGPNEWPCDLGCDSSGNFFITGRTNSSSFPTFNPGGSSYFQGVFDLWDKAFILKFNDAGVRLWATYYGGSHQEMGYSLAVDSFENIIIVGETNSDDFPLFDPGSGAFFQAGYAGSIDGFILKFNNNGTRLWATYLGGNLEETCRAVCTDETGNIFIAGETASNSFPLLNPGGGAFFQGTKEGYRDLFIIKFSNNGGQIWSTYYGGTQSEVSNSICTDPFGNIFVTGNTNSIDFPTFNPGGGTYFQGTNSGESDAFILKFTNNCEQLWATYYGGELGDMGNSIRITKDGKIILTGNTTSYNLPTFNPGGGAYFFGTKGVSYFASFAAKFSNTGIIEWATYLNDMYISGICTNIAIDACNNFYLTFTTQNNNLPIIQQCIGSYSGSYISSPTILFILKFNNSNNLVWTSYLGGSETDYYASTIINKDNNLLMVGRIHTNNNILLNYPLMDPGGGVYFQNTVGNGSCLFISKFTTSVSSTTSVTTTNCHSTGTATLNNICMPNSIEWYDNNWNLINSSNQSIGNLGAGNYQVVVNDSNVCFIDTVYFEILNSVPELSGIDTICNGENTTLIASGGTDYFWNTNDTTSSITVSPTQDTIYSVIISNLGCNDDDTLYSQITVVPIPIVTITGDTVLCAGYSTTLTASGATNYIWSTNESASTITVTPTIDSVFNVIASNFNCFDTASISIKINPLPVAIIKGDSIICVGSSTTLTASGGSSYTWATGENSNSIVVSPGQNSTYSVTVDDGLCKNSASFKLFVEENPKAAIIGNSIVCKGSPVELSASGGRDFLWSNNSTEKSITVTPEENTKYSIMVSNGQCRDSASILLTVYEKPIASIYPDTSIVAGSSFSLSASGGMDYIWSPSEGLSCTDCPSPIASPVETTEYCVKVTDANGCSEIVCTIISVSELQCGEVFIPSAFSPNNDQENDLHCVYGKCIESLYFAIFNRWGEKVFETIDKNQCWDGTYKGQLLNTGVFVYVLEAKLVNGEKISKSGNVSLIR